MQFFTAHILPTSDGSNTLEHPILGDTYHSVNGAAEESGHVYIDCGLRSLDKKNVRIFEMGFGSGLNALLTLDYAVKIGAKIDYTAVELYPLDIKNVIGLEYNRLVSAEIYDLFIYMHNADWGVKTQICDNFCITKLNQNLAIASLPGSIDLVYFDAFAPDTQPQLWSVEQFQRIYENMTSGAILTTYSSKGIVKQALRQVGFKVERLNGVGGKRHILRCTRL